MTRNRDLEEISRVYVAGRRNVLFTAAWIFSTLLTVNILMLVGLAIGKTHWITVVASLVSLVGSSGFTAAILSQSIFGDIRRIWMLYKGTPVELDYDNGDRVREWMKTTLEPHEYYFHMGGFVVVFKEPENAALVRLMVD